MKHIALLFSAVALFMAGCSGNEEKIGGSGLIETDQVLVSAETSGRVIDKRFDEGTELAVGDTLLIIDPTRVQLQLAAARASKDVAEAKLRAARTQLEQAKDAEAYAQTELERVTRLLKSGTATQRQYDKVKFEYTSAVSTKETAAAQIKTIEAEIEKIAAEIGRAQQELDYTHPLAPIAGTVTDKYVEMGELLSPGRPIASIANLDSVYVKIYLNAGSFAHVKLGDSATVDTESGGQTFRGAVVWTADEAEFTPKNVQTEESRAGLVYAVKVDISNPDHILKVGMPVFVTLDTK